MIHDDVQSVSSEKSWFWKTENKCHTRADCVVACAAWTHQLCWTDVLVHIFHMIVNRLQGKKTLQKWGMFLFHSNPQLKRSPFLLKGQWCILCFSKNREWENTIEQAGHLYLFSASMSFFSWDWKKDGNWSKNCAKGVRLNWLSWNWPHCGLSSTASCGILADISHTHRAFQSYALHWGASVVQMWSYTLYDNVRTQFDLDPYTNVD